MQDDQQLGIHQIVLLTPGSYGSGLKEVNKNTKVDLSTKQEDGPDKKTDNEIKPTEDTITDEAVF